MDFLLDELIIIMFLVLLLLLFISSLIAVNFYKFLLLETNDFTKKTGPEIEQEDFINNYGIIDDAEYILKEKITYFKDE
jgi:hypothetical protein